MSKKEYLLTTEGFLELETELNYLKLERRPLIIEAIKDARAQGDLSENADYDAARTEQAEVESRIAELEHMLGNAKIIEKNGCIDTVDLGCSVVIEYIDDNEEEEYKIVGSMEADPLDNKISNESPLGEKILNRKVGDIVSIESPNGSYQIKIVKIA